MTSRDLKKIIRFAIKNRLPILIKGAPGIGKTDCVKQACEAEKVELIVSHPVVSDPTDYKGLPFKKDDSQASFLPFGDLLYLIKADKPTVFFADDLGQAPASVQAAMMQLILARQINGKKVSDKVIFVAATNRRQDKAGVMGLLEPVKSRFAAILQLDVDLDSWVEWAINNNMPHELISFIKFRPELLHKFEPTSDIVNTPNPRSIAYVGIMMNAGMSNMGGRGSRSSNGKDDVRAELFTGAAGEGFATEFIGYLDIFLKLPDINKILSAPTKSEVPDQMAMKYALCGALAVRINKSNIDNAVKYIRRLEGEYQTLFMKELLLRKRSLANEKAFMAWTADNRDVIINIDS